MVGSLQRSTSTARTATALAAATAAMLDRRTSIEAHEVPLHRQLGFITTTLVSYNFCSSQTAKLYFDFNSAQPSALFYENDLTDTTGSMDCMIYVGDMALDSGTAMSACTVPFFLSAGPA